ncbi:hypothetical protein OSG_eHP32_00140 [environmental Halophage eHP-32]|nr:hypothetical protein OSG_eHP32_00140 [environmental Halophage eHP-32]
MPTDTKTVPIFHDRYLATINGELWDTTSDRRELLRAVERAHHSDHSDATARDIHVFAPGESPNWMWDLATAVPRKYEQEIEVEVEAPTSDAAGVTDEELETMEDFL